MEEENKEETEIEKLSPEEELNKIGEICRKLNYVFEQNKDKDEKEESRNSTTNQKNI